LRYRRIERIDRQGIVETDQLTRSAGNRAKGMDHLDGHLGGGFLQQGELPLLKPLQGRGSVDR
jgi:hypothetical protein